MPTVVARFAPSPTGYLHVGGARTALFNWLLARHTGGKFLLRIEDTDLARSTEDATRQLLSDLQWLGLNWDNSELVYQSKRLPIYNKIIDDLLSRGQAYEAWESAEELDSMRQQAARAKRPFIYKRQAYSPDQLRRFADEGRKPVVRFAMPVKEYRFHDITLGKDIVQTPYEIQDFVIRKGDGMPTYHFGVVVDDAEMGVTHVLRGLEHLLNTINHIGLQEALGYPRPIYSHLPVILNIDGSKMGKRDRDNRIRHGSEIELKKQTLFFKNMHQERPNPKFSELVRRYMEEHKWELLRYRKVSELYFNNRLGNPEVFDTWIEDRSVQLGSFDDQWILMQFTGIREADLPEIQVHDFRKNGYVPEVLLNFIALLGWSPGGDREQMTIDEMIELFSLEKVGSSNAKFGRDKLKSFSTDFFAKAPASRTISAMRDYLLANPESPLNRATDDELAKLLHMNAGFHILREVDEKSGFFFMPDDELVHAAAAVEKVLMKNEKQGLQALSAIRPILAAVEPWSTANLEAAVKNYCEQSGLALGKVAQPIRVAVSGTSVSPPIFESLEFLGRTKTLARIDSLLAK